MKKLQKYTKEKDELSVSEDDVEPEQCSKSDLASRVSNRQDTMRGHPSEFSVQPNKVINFAEMEDEVQYLEPKIFDKSDPSK